MKHLLLQLLIFSIFPLHGNGISFLEKKADDSTFYFPIKKTHSYNIVKTNIISKKNQITNTKELSNHLYHSLIFSIFPHWYGTSWDFNGYTNVPNKGYIACGYFVSTTLKHIGFHLNRYTLAQQSSLHEVKTIDSNFHSLKGCSVDSLQNYCKRNLADGIYIVGLDYHVGYLVQDKGHTFFIHSDPTKGVIQEPVNSSYMFNNSTNFYIGAISTNESLLQKWKQNLEIKIIK